MSRQQDSVATLATRGIDVFDMAVCRLVHLPVHVHFNVGRKLRARGLIDCSDEEWAYAREKAEYAETRSTQPTARILDSIYRELARVFSMSPDDARIALQAEIDEEHRLTRPVASTRRHISDLNSDGIIPSFRANTCLSIREVKSILTNAGYSSSIHVIGSGNRSRIKLIKALTVRMRDPGASQNSRTYLFSGRHSRERVLAASGGGGFIVSAVSGSAKAARLAQQHPVDAGVASVAATVVGPLFASYCLWVLRDVAARGGQRIHFLARDGQVLAPICRRLSDWLGLDIQIEYTLASRQAFLLAALPSRGPSTVDTALQLAFYGSIDIANALTSLEYSPEEINAILQLVSINQNSTRADLAGNKLGSLRSVLLREEFLAPLQDRVLASHKATLAYLKSVGLFEHADAYIVDLGWRGTTQLRLERAVGDRVKISGYYLGLSNRVLPDESSTRVWSPPVSVKPALLEVMASADHTSVRGFGLSENGNPVCNPPIKTDTRLIAWGSREQQEIALRFVEYFTEAVELEYYPLDEVQAALELAAIDGYRHFILAPTAVEAKHYGEILHSEDVNHVIERQLASCMSSLDVVRHVVLRRPRANATSWYIGSLSRSRRYLIPALASLGIERSLALLVHIRLGTQRQIRRTRARRSLRLRKPDKAKPNV